MANIRLIKRRIRTAKNIAQITKAMELVAAAKMRKAQGAAKAGKLYADTMYDMVMRLSSQVDLTGHPLLAMPEASGKRLIIMITTNKGLCGGLNANLFRFFLRQYGGTIRSHAYITLGRKGTDFLARSGALVSADFSTSPPFVDAVPALTELVTREFLTGAYEGVDLVFQQFNSIQSQEPTRRVILPVRLPLVKESAKAISVVVEPNTRRVLELLLPHYIENQIRDAILQAEASEHSACVVAMHKATENAKGLMVDLTLLYNKARQEKITYEISDMVTARLAVGE